MPKVLQLALEFEPWIIALRRHFHMYPEASMEEYLTTAKIAEELDKLGVRYERFEACPGLVAKIEGKNPGKAIALRSDIDALGVQENNDIDYKSKTDGLMHACGHDAHAAMNLGAVRILNEMQDEISGTVYFVFQPAEEIGKGALAIIEQGEWYEKIDNIFGAHIWANIDAGKFSVETGPRMASADRFEIRVHGKAGHGAQPEQTVDATLVASAIVMNLQSIASREFGPLEPVVVTVGQLHSGTRFNVISGEAMLEGTIRYFSKEVGEQIEGIVKRIAEETAKAFRADVELVYDYYIPPLINKEESSSRAAKTVQKLFGSDAVELYTHTTAAEDFSYYLNGGKPGIFAFIGCRNPDIGADFPHHHSCFNIDESVLKNGAALYAQYALDFLNE